VKKSSYQAESWTRKTPLALQRSVIYIRMTLDLSSHGLIESVVTILPTGQEKRQRAVT
jgi:hypothetical protein